MGWERIHLTREELFEQIWSKPTTKLAMEYGISDVGLAKICKKLNIPRPPKGYWLRKYPGKPPTLPPTKGPTEHVIQKWVMPALELDSAQKSEREMLIDQEKLPANLLQANEGSEELHRLALRTQEQLLKAASKKSKSDRSWVRGGPKSLNVCVSPPLIHRAIPIMDVLVKGLEKRKHKIALENGQTYVTVMGEKFSITLEETSTRIDHEPTEKEIRQMEKYSWMRPEKYDYLPSGRLSLKIDKDSYGHRRSWNDGKKKRIENCLNDVIIGLIDSAFKEKSRRAENERRERERKEYEKLKHEKQEAIRKEKAKLKDLETVAEDWHKSQKLRAFIEAVRHVSDDVRIGTGEDVSDWLDWATQQADRLDPLAKSPPSVLDEEEKWCGYNRW